MGILTIGCCLMVFPTVVLLVGNTFVLPKKYHKMQTFLDKYGRWLGFNSLVLIFALLITIPLYQSSVLTKDAEVACVINTNGSRKNVYHNIDDDKYFILHLNDWNIFHMYSIEYLDNDVAKKIIEVAEIVNNWND